MLAVRRCPWLALVMLERERHQPLMLLMLASFPELCIDSMFSPQHLVILAARFVEPPFAEKLWRHAITAYC